MVSVITCIVCFALANFGVQAFHEVPDYQGALGTSWSQAWAVMIYYFIWAKE
jgi:hypothetical protein